MKITERAVSTERKRKAISGIIASIIMFAMLFTVGLGYFMFTTQSAAALALSQSARLNSIQQAGGEKVYMRAQLVKATSCVAFTITNQGAAPMTLVSVYGTDSKGNAMQVPAGGGVFFTTPTANVPTCTPAISAGLNATLPKTLDVGQNFNISTPFTFTGSRLAVSVVTSKGNAFSATYPAPPLTTVVTDISNCNACSSVTSITSIVTSVTSLTSVTSVTSLTSVTSVACTGTLTQTCTAEIASVAEGLGFISLDFNSFRWYDLTSAGGCSSGLGGGADPPLNPTRACALSPTTVGAAPLAYTISTTSASPVWNGVNSVLSANITNSDPQKRSMTIDANSQIWFSSFNLGSGGGRSHSETYGLVNVANVNGIPSKPLTTQTSTPSITVPWGQTVTVFYGLNNGGDPGEVGFVTPIFLLFHGSLTCSVGNSLCTPGTIAFGEDLPFASTLWT